jgi:hypothetical protein
MADRAAPAELVQPWVTRASTGQLVADRGRPFVLLPGEVKHVTLNGSGELLPMMGSFSDHRRIEFKKFEIPATTGASAAGPTDDLIALSITDADGARRLLHIRLQRGIPESFRNSDEADTETAWQLATQAAACMIDLHLGLIFHLYEDAAARTAVGSGKGTWLLPQVLDAWRAVGHQSGPRPALIVGLAGRLSYLLKAVCAQPSRALTRHRQLQPAGRIQDMDATCLRWLARQPGTSMAEKVGVKQLALGIACIETPQTLENRVVADLVRVSAKACDRYLDEHRQEAEHERVADVARFRELLTRLASTAPLAELEPLQRIARPNNVLLHDPRYRPLWNAYLSLHEQQLQRTAAWRWRHRIWSETCQLALLAALEKIARRSVAARSTLLIRSEQVCGRFIDARAAVGRWEIRRGDAAYSILLVEARHFDQYQAVAPFPAQLANLCPDMALICRDARAPDKPALRILGIWTVFDFDLDADQLDARSQQILEALRLIRTPSELHGRLLQPDCEMVPDSTAERPSECIHVDRTTGHVCRGVRLRLPLQQHETLIASLLEDVLA